LLPLRLDFERDPGAGSSPTKLRLRLIDSDGFLWGEADELLGSGFGLPSGPRWSERRAVPVLAGAGPNDVKIEAQLYVEEPGGARPLGTLELGRAAIASSDRFWAGQIAGFHAADATNGPWRLLGWAGADSRATGERAYLTTVWREEASTSQTGSLGGGSADPLEQLLRLVGPNGQSAPIRSATLADASIGTVRRVQMAPPIGARLIPGAYRYELAVRPTGGEPRAWSDGAAWHLLGTLRVVPGPPVPPPLPAANPIDARFGGAIRLRGYTFSTAPIAVTLQWEALADVPRSLSVFVHVLDVGGQIQAQSDGPPARGRAPTDGWSPGDVVDDRRELTAAPGEYRVVVGLYDPRSGERLPAVSASGQTLGDAVELGRLRVDG
jgi:hypothetical protein